MFDKSVSWFNVSCRLITDDETDLGQVYQISYPENSINMCKVSIVYKEPL